MRWLDDVEQRWKTEIDEPLGNGPCGDVCYAPQDIARLVRVARAAEEVCEANKTYWSHKGAVAYTVTVRNAIGKLKDVLEEVQE